jgi:hypothetical protein
MDLIGEGFVRLHRLIPRMMHDRLARLAFVMIGYPLKSLITRPSLNSVTVTVGGGSGGETTTSKEQPKPAGITNSSASKTVRVGGAAWTDGMATSDRTTASTSAETVPIASRLAHNHTWSSLPGRPGTTRRADGRGGPLVCADRRRRVSPGKYAYRRIGHTGSPRRTEPECPVSVTSASLGARTVVEEVELALYEIHRTTPSVIVKCYAGGT